MAEREGKSFGSPLRREEKRRTKVTVFSILVTAIEMKEVEERRWQQ